MSGPAPEHAGAVAAARAHLEGRGEAPLGPLPAGFPEARLALHRVAEDVLKPKRELETGNEIALRFTPGGFGTPPWDAGLASGVAGEARVEGTDLVIVTGAEVARTPLADPAISPEAVAAVADWFAFGTVVLADLIDARRDAGASPIRLWPEHFDVATEVGSEADGTRATAGASPGDENHPEPYLYVGPWSAPTAGPLWNATGFTGAEVGHGELLGAVDQYGAAAGFFAGRLDAIA
ncbi:MAG: hypothetical protein R2718_09575 [Solirubrobacterales bacterium]